MILSVRRAQRAAPGAFLAAAFALLLAPLAAAGAAEPATSAEAPASRMSEPKATEPKAAETRAGEAKPERREPRADLTVTAQLLAGREPESTDADVQSLVADPEWRKHRDAIHAARAKLQKRLELTEAWRKEHLPAMGPGSTLLYPFSGPDFLNAYALFPEADTYVFFGLESPGEVPNLAGVAPARREKLFADLRFSLNNLIARNFFVTSYMMKDLHTDALHGTIPVMLAMMGLLDLQVVGVEPYQPWAAQHTPRAVRIEFLNPRTQRHQTLLYVAQDVSDAHLARVPQFIPWFEQFPQPTVFLKSASYLLHGVEFKILRKSILRQGQVLVQDDTGVPFHLLRDAGFDIRLYGQYEQPIKDFVAYYQPDLDQAFQKTGNDKPLPFPFGYSWYMHGRSGLLLAVRTAETK